MNSTINERIVKLIETLKMSNNAFAKSIDKSSTAINYISDGKGKPSYDVLESIFKRYPQVSRDWLLMGEGEMFRTSAPVNKPVDGGDFGERVLMEVRRLFEEELKEKNAQIASLSRMLEMTLGKSKGVSSSQVVSQGIRNTPFQVIQGAELGWVFKKFGS
ncbi:helix-turn-helix transcriptional regulator [Arsenicibacter rosenii]|uniref:HTH cro/C1-type domain-containing protein n=1 Tax=Arsenicibacter rosenii TaxID=1750698 RepID=A0A1S2VAF2_9BACT|nr:helix-turn-helix transcriptional regulator [Arsenicibacter rosenii]OIN55673.1 hypothetical protein BLX24_28760 [Arsenicibacter rosenii]